MKNQIATNSHPREHGTKHKYASALYAILAHLAQKGGSAPAVEVNGILRKHEASIALTGAIKDSGLVKTTRQGMIGQKGSSVNYHLTDKAIHGQYEMRDVLGRFFVNRALKMQGYAAAAKQKAEAAAKITKPEPAPEPKVKTGTQLQLLIDSGDFNLLQTFEPMTFDQWIEKVKSYGFLIFKPV